MYGFSLLLPQAVEAPGLSLAAFHSVSLWAGMSLAVYVYVNFCITARPHPLRSRHGSLRDVFVLLLLSPVMAWSAAQVWREAPHEAERLAFLTLACAGAAHHLSFIQRFGLDVGSLSAQCLVEGGSSKSRILALVKVLAAISLAWWHGALSVWRGSVWHLLPWSAVVLGVLVLAALSCHYTHLHIHHWAAGLMLMPLASVGWPTASAALLGLGWGMMVEGAARWSCAPLLHLKYDISEADLQREEASLMQWVNDGSTRI